MSATNIRSEQGVVTVRGHKVDMKLEAVVIPVLDVAARDDLIRRGIEISELFHDMGGVFHHFVEKCLLSGPNPRRQSVATYASFNDPVGNGWVFQEVTAHLSGDIKAGDTRFTRELLNAIGIAAAVQ